MKACNCLYRVVVGTHSETQNLLCYYKRMNFLCHNIAGLHVSPSFTLEREFSVQGLSEWRIIIIRCSLLMIDSSVLSRNPFAFGP